MVDVRIADVDERRRAELVSRRRSWPVTRWTSFDGALEACAEGVAEVAEVAGDDEAS